MRVLMLTGGIPYPPASGGALRAYGILKGLHAHGHQVTLFALDDRPDFKPASTPLAALCEAVHIARPPKRSSITRLRDLLLSRQPDIAHRLLSPQAAAQLKDLLAAASFDLIQAEGIEVASYLPVAHEAQPKARLCFDTFNAEYVLQRVIAQIDSRSPNRLMLSLYSRIQARRIERFERAMCQLADLLIVVSPEDHAALHNFRTDTRAHVVPSGISVNNYTQPHPQSVDLGPAALVFSGKMDYRPNVDAMLWFTEAVLPLIQAQMPEARLVIVGQRPHPRLAHLTERPNVTLTGWVDSVQPYLDAAAVYIAPLRMGSGTRLKLLEAMAAGRAIVATTTAAAGLLPEAKAAMRIADTPKAFAQNVIDLLHDPAQRVSLGEEAQVQVRAHYDWSVLIPRLLDAYATIGLLPEQPEGDSA